MDERAIKREVKAPVRAPQDINANLTATHIISSSRTQQPPEAYREWQTHMVTTLKDANYNKQYYAAFSTAIYY
jgi:hypothetical protein